jgi:hypothetical protein
MRERPHNPDAADLAMPARARFNSSGDSKLIQSDIIDLNERALALDPQNEPAMVDLSEALTDRVTNQWSANPEGNLARADKLAAPLWPFSRTMRGPYGEGGGLLQQTPMESGNISG